jgi:hypothetical protein
LPHGTKQEATEAEERERNRKREKERETWMAAKRTVDDVGEAAV